LEVILDKIYIIATIILIMIDKDWFKLVNSKEKDVEKWMKDYKEYIQKKKK
jgi:hypothetical protein